MPMAAIDLGVAKVVSAVVLSGASVIGLVAPFVLLRFVQYQSVLSIQSFTSLANCLSAGILLWTGVMHFFVESVSAGIGETNAMQNTTLATIESSVRGASLYFVAGLILPLVVEKILWPLVTVQQPLSDVSDSAIMCGATEREEDSISVVMAAHAHSHSHGHKTSSQCTTSRQTSSTIGGAASAVLIAVLMSVHSATEGVAVGLEPTIHSLRRSVLPLIVHKIFDGWVVGMSNANGANSTLQHIRWLWFKAPQRFSLWIWLVALPVALLVCSLVPQSQAHTHADGHAHAGGSFSTTAQSVSAGSFVYVAVVGILIEELKEEGNVPFRTLLMMMTSCGMILGSVLTD